MVRGPLEWASEVSVLHERCHLYLLSIVLISSVLLQMNFVLA